MLFFLKGKLVGIGNIENSIKYDFFLEENKLNQQDIDKLLDGYSLNYDDLILYLTQEEQDKKNEFLLKEKKQECRDKILANYSETDQRNILMSGDTTAISEMNTFIQAMITEYQTNGKDANYSNINP